MDIADRDSGLHAPVPDPKFFVTRWEPRSGGQPTAGKSLTDGGTTLRGVRAYRRCAAPIEKFFETFGTLRR